MNTDIKDLKLSYYARPVSETDKKMILAKNPNFKGNIANVYSDETITLYNLVTEMTSESSKLYGLFNVIRAYYDKDKEISSGFKKCVPYVLVSGIAQYRNTDHFEISSYTWLLPFDIDKKDNVDIEWKELFEKICKNDSVVTVARSTSGKGIKGILRLKKDAYDPALIYTLAKTNIYPYLETQWGCKLDIAQGKLVQPFYLTWDKDGYVNWEAKELDVDYGITLIDIEQSGDEEGVTPTKKLTIASLERLLSKIRTVKEAGTRYNTVGSTSMFIGGLFAGEVFPKNLKEEKVINELRKAVFENRFIPDQGGYFKWAQTSFNYGKKFPITENDLKTSTGIKKIEKILGSSREVSCDGAIPFIRIGNDYWKEIWEEKDVNGHIRREKRLYPYKKQTIVDDYGNDFINIIPRYEDFINEPNYFNEYTSERYYNIVNPLIYAPAKGSWKTIEHLYKHIFGNQWHYGIAYTQLGLLKPKQKLPVLCIVSKENETGKTTFIDFLHELLYGNMAIISTWDFEQGFNRHWITKQFIAIDESELDSNTNTSKIKQLSTQKKVAINEKFVGISHIDFYAKFIILSNNEEGFLKINDEDKRYWVVKPPLVKHFDPEYEEKLINEIPAFMEYLINNPLLYPEKKSRLWFDIEELQTETLQKVKEYNRSPIWHNLFPIIDEYFFSNPQNEEWVATPTTIRKKDDWISKSYSNKAIAKCLRDEFKATTSVTIKRYYDCITEQEEIGKPWTIHRSSSIRSISKDLLEGL